MTVTQQLSPSSLRALKSSRYANGQASKMMLEAKAAKRITSQFMSKAGAKEAAKRIRKLKKTAKNTGEAVDGMLKTTKGKNIVQKGVAAGKKIGAIAFIAGIVGVLVAKVATDIQIQDIGFSNEIRTESEFQKAFQRYQRNLLDIRSLTKQYNDFKKVIDKNNKDLDSVSKEIFPIKENNRKILKQQNDITYEVRQGRKIVEDKIAQQARTLDTIKKDLAKALQGTKDNFQSAINTTIKELQASLAKANSEISKANGTITTLNDTVKRLQTTVTSIPRAVQEVNRVAGNTITQVTKEIGRAIAAPAKRWGVTITPVTVTPATVTVAESGGVTVTPATVTPAQITFSDFSTSDAADYAREIQRRESVKQEAINSTLAGGLSNVASAAQQAASIANTALQEARVKGGVSIDTSAIEKRITDTERRINADISGLKTEIGKIDKVNEQANKKLDSVIPDIKAIAATLPLIPARSASATFDKLNPLVNPDAIANGVQTGMCRSLQGGCGKKAVDDAVNDIKQHNNQNTGSVLDAVNAGLNTADLALLGVINDKLGDQVPNGLSGFLKRFSNWSVLNQVMQMMTFATTVHNAAMLSNDLGQTLLGIISNVLQFFGIKNSEGQAFNISDIIGRSIESFIQSIIGNDNYNAISEAWAKANRIYQASANLLNSLMNVNAVITNALEVIGSYTGKIGNALRIWGVVGEKAYSWMNPQPSFDNKWMTKLQQLQENANTVAMVAQIPIDATNAVTELNNSATEFVKAIKQEPDTKSGIDVGEAAQVKTEREAAKAVSASLNFDISDLFDADE